MLEKFNSTKNWPALLPLIGTIILAIILQKYVLSKPEMVQEWLRSYGWMAIGIYALIQATTIIIAPLGGLWAQITIIGLYGPLVGMILVYLIATPCYLVNFYLARRYGRQWIGKLIGEEHLSTIDKYAHHLGKWVLILLKIQGGSFDFVAYAAGLTQISFKMFVFINFVWGIPGTILNYLIFKYSPNLLTGLLVVQIVTFCMLTIATMVLYPKIQKEV